VSFGIPPEITKRDYFLSRGDLPVIWFGVLFVGLRLASALAPRVFVYVPLVLSSVDIVHEFGYGLIRVSLKSTKSSSLVF